MKTGNHGLMVLGRDDDLYVLFGEEEPGATFAEIIEDVLTADNFQAGVQEKKEAALGGRLLPIHERLRKFPAPESEIDLHGYTAREAARKIDSFVRTASSNGLRTLRIITGKGLHSEGEAVLPVVVEEQLRALKRDRMVLACRWEGRSRMSSGSVLVYLEP